MCSTLTHVIFEVSQYSLTLKVLQKSLEISGGLGLEIHFYSYSIVYCHCLSATPTLIIFKVAQ